MTEHKDKDEAAWILAMVELEEQLGPIVPGGAQGGAGVRARLAREQAKGAAAPVRPSAASRARQRVRATYQAREDEAA